MHNHHRVTIQIAGESGQGINSIGEAVAKAFKKVGLHTFGYREYPSLIRGGHALYQLEASHEAVTAPCAKSDLLVCLSRVSFHQYYQRVNTGGTIIHSVPRLDVKPDEQKWLTEQDINVVYINAAKLAEESGGKRLMSNTVFVGVLWSLFELPIETAEEVIREIFAHKPHYIDVNLACLETGYQQQVETDQRISLQVTDDQSVKEGYLLSGNHALALGAVAAGARAYYSYPMTPSSSILSYLAEIQHETGMIVKQVDDEISAAQMAIGSMFMGTRAFTGTSGGGFDLMTESVSLVGITETPFVCVLAQRPGPATGLPTWTSAADLTLAVYGGHGEFPRIVVAASDATSAFTTIQEAFNLAEQFQTAVIVLTEKQIAESIFLVSEFPESPPINRHLTPDSDNLTPKDRFKITDSGISPRWLPGQSDATYVANSDEHLEDGSLTEDAVPAKAMYDKRLRKMEGILETLPEPILYGSPGAEITFVGWGSVKSTILDAFTTFAHSKKTLPCNYLHYEYVYPLKTAHFQQLVNENKRIILLENNATGQLGSLLTQATGYMFKEKLLKYDGRPFFVEEILNFIATHVEKTQKGAN
jgi:2-oxoglutarate ferredoxin oxidoreductase subunit alpha